jgi:uncharacterized repeat protein (TIGR01451 family)
MSTYHRPLFGLLLFSLFLIGGGHAQAQTRTFQRAFSGNLPGQLVVIGNTIVGCDRARNPAATCDAVENGTDVPTLANDTVVTSLIDMDGDAATFNSSSATLGIGGQVEWAGLYWWGSIDPSGATMTVPTQAQGSVLLKAPGGTYASVLSSWIVPGDPYVAFADVTEIVKGNGTGAYQVANVVAFPGSDDHLGGWSLVVVNRDSALPFRHISVYDGYQEYGNGNAVTVPLQNFLTPLIGELNAQATFVALDGDAGKSDEVTFNGTRLSNTLNPTGDFGNSTISKSGAVVSTRNPAFGNTLGSDIDTFDVGALLSNGAINATATFAGATGETNFAAVMGFQTTLYSPDIRSEKQVADLDGAPTRPGDTLEYTVSIRNTDTSLDGAIRVAMTDVVPANTTYVTNSLKVTKTTTNAAPIGPLTDALDNDVGSYDAIRNHLRVNLGIFATPTVGGTMGPGDSIEIKFRVIVDPELDQTATVLNQAAVTFEGLTLSSTANSALISVASNSPDGGPTKIAILPIDIDDDGLSDKRETKLGTNPNDADTDDDGVLDGLEARLDADSDDDGKINALDPDSDNDGLFDGTEIGKDCNNVATDRSKSVCVPDADPNSTTSPIRADSDMGRIDDAIEDPNKNGQIDAGETDPNNAADDAGITDTDFDGLSDAIEKAIGTDPTDGDSDDDGVTDGAEPSYAVDSDRDGLINARDSDSDNDAIFDGTELASDCSKPATKASDGYCVADADIATQTNALVKDSDGGGKSDGAEDANRNGKLDTNETDPNNAADDMSAVDADEDGLSNAEENLIGSNPQDSDSDDDGLRDGDEPNPTADTDRDGLINLLDSDSDNDGLFDGTESGKDCSLSATNPATHACVPDADPATNTRPLNRDTDRGGKSDGAEDANFNGSINAGETDPNNSADDQVAIDTDGDGLSDAQEAVIGSNPMDADSDDDGLLDGLEANPTGDSDGDRLTNILDADSDNDSLYDGTEAGKDCSNPATLAAAKHCVADADGGGYTTSTVKSDTDAGGKSDGAEDSNLNGSANSGETDPNNPVDDKAVVDADGDGLSDLQEMTLGSDTKDPDSDDDGLLDGLEANPADDGDGDGIRNVLDPDSDGDGIFDGTESTKDCANPATDRTKLFCVADADPTTSTSGITRDSDRGGVSDGLEDKNRNGIVDMNEGNPNDPRDDQRLVIDTDNDGLSDETEIVLGSNPNDADSDDDGLLDGQELNPSVDTDSDTLKNVIDPDSDGDGLFDGTESGKDCSNPATDPTKATCIADADMGMSVTSLIKNDSDTGGAMDGFEDPNHNGRIDIGETNPNDAADDRAAPGVNIDSGSGSIGGGGIDCAFVPGHRSYTVPWMVILSLAFTWVGVLRRRR